MKTLSKALFFIVILLNFQVGNAATKSTSYTLPGFSDIHFYELDNGLQLVMWPDNAAKQASMEMWYRVGALHEAPGITGIAHLFEHMLLRPSKYAPQGAMAFERTMGATIGASTRFRTTNFYTSVAPEKLEEILRYQADIMKNFPLDAKMLANEKEAVRSEYLNWDNSPFMVLLPELSKHTYPNHIAQNFITGARADLRRITAQDCIAFYRKYYNPNNAILVVTGKITPENVMAQVEHYFGGIPKGTEARIPKDLKSLPKKVMVTKSVPGGSFPVAVTYPLPFGVMSSKDEAAVNLAFEIAFKDKTSLVGDNLINRQKLADSVDFENLGLGFYFVAMSLIGNNGAQALKGLDASVESLQKLDAEAYERFIVSSEADLLRRLQTSRQRATLLGYYMTHRNGIEALKMDLALSKSLPLADFKSAAAKYLNSNHRVAVVGVPKGGK